MESQMYGKNRKAGKLAMGEGAGAVINIVFLCILLPNMGIVSGVLSDKLRAIPVYPIHPTPTSARFPSRTQG